MSGVRGLPGVTSRVRAGRGLIVRMVLPSLGDAVGAAAHTGVMTFPLPGQPRVLDRPACTPAAIRAVLAANAGSEVLARYDSELDAAFEQARRDQDLTALVRTVRRWWFEADAWRDPISQREFLARMDRYAAAGPPPAERRVTREEIRARHGV
jgi:hypothetical protein